MPLSLSFCGHFVTRDELRLIRVIVNDFAALSFTELSISMAICEILDRRRPAGGIKKHECYIFFLKQLKNRGLLSSLPEIHGTSCCDPAWPENRTRALRHRTSAEPKWPNSRLRSNRPDLQGHSPQAAFLMSPVRCLAGAPGWVLNPNPKPSCEEAASCGNRWASGCDM